MIKEILKLLLQQELKYLQIHYTENGFGKII